MAAEMITALTIIFITTSIVLFIFNRLSHPSIPAYIIAGLGMGRFIPQESLLALSQAGIAFLVFIFGARIDFEETIHTIQENAIVTLVEVVGVGAGAYTISSVIGFDALNASYIAIAASFSSSLVATDLIDRHKNTLIYSRLASSINLLQDLVAILCFLVLVPQATGGIAGISSVFVGIAIVILGFLLRPVFPYVAAAVEESRELTMLLGVSILTIFLALTGYLGLSLVIGSFSAGIAVSSYPYNIGVLETVSGLKDFFAAIFFVSLGALVKVPTLPVVSIASALIFASLLLKPALIVTVLNWNGYDSRTAYMTALHMDQMSEFALIVAIQAFIAETMVPEVFDAIVLAAIITMLISSYTSRHAGKIYDFLRKADLVGDWWNVRDHMIDKPLNDHIIVAGFDTQGQEIAKKLQNEEIQFIIIDNDPSKILKAKEEGYNYVFGDIHVEDTWNMAEAANASLIVSTVPFKSVNREIVSLDIVADKMLRAPDVEEAAQFLDESLYVIYPDLLASEKLIQHIKGAMNSGNYRERLRNRSRKELE